MSWTSAPPPDAALAEPSAVVPSDVVATGAPADALPERHVIQGYGGSGLSRDGVLVVLAVVAYRQGRSFSLLE